MKGLSTGHFFDRINMIYWIYFREDFMRDGEAARRAVSASLSSSAALCLFYWIFLFNRINPLWRKGDKLSFAFSLLFFDITVDGIYIIIKLLSIIIS